MSIKGVAYIAGAFEHPLRKAPDTSVAALHAECARGALADASAVTSDAERASRYMRTSSIWPFTNAVRSSGENF